METAGGLVCLTPLPHLLGFSDLQVTGNVALEIGSKDPCSCSVCGILFITILGGPLRISAVSDRLDHGFPRLGREPRDGGACCAGRCSRLGWGPPGLVPPETLAPDQRLG